MSGDSSTFWLSCQKDLLFFNLAGGVVFDKNFQKKFKLISFFGNLLSLLCERF